MQPLQLYGRSSSHFTRVVRMLADELSVPMTMSVVHDVKQTGSEAFGGNPALKLPVLVRPQGTLAGTLNICRVVAESAPVEKRIVWPEDVKSDLARNADELMWNAMAQQVVLVLGTKLYGLPADNLFFVKTRAGIEGSMRWLDAKLDAVLAELPAARDLSLFELALFCLCEHLVFRETVPLSRFPALQAWAATFAERPSAKKTGYAFDAAP